MTSRSRFLWVMCFALCIFCPAGNGSQSASEVVVSNYLEHLSTADIDALDSLFFKIPLIETHQEDWLKLLQHIADKVRDEQLAWEVVCSKELAETAIVIVNQTMKQGQPHGDPDTISLVKRGDQWLLLPDTIAHGAKDEVRKVMSDSQLLDRRKLRSWATGEIRGLTSDCS